MSKLSRLQNWINFNHQFMFWRSWSNGPLSRLWWKLQHTYNHRHQYNRLDTGLPPGYYDPTTQILHAVMNCFRQYMERGAPEFCYGNEMYEDYVPMFTDVDGTVNEDG